MKPCPVCHANVIPSADRIPRHHCAHQRKHGTCPASGQPFRITKGDNL